jgi:hypothetical protein
MSPTSLTGSSRRVSPAALLLVPLGVAIVLAMFVWPSARLEPRDLPVAVAGPPAATEQIERKLAADAGAFDVERLPDEAAARAAIDDRDVYGAIVAAPDGPKVLTASAASASVAELLEDATGTRAHVEDVAPAPEHATGLGATVLPLIITGSIVAAVAALLATGVLARAGLVIGGSILAGVTATALLHSWHGVVDGDWGAVAAALSLTVLATAAVVAGLQALLGQPGMALGALLMTFVGNPLSGVGTAPELLPQPFGEIGQLMPPGAGGNLLRSTGYFDGARAEEHAIVLVAWAAAGLTLLLASALRSRRPAPVVAPAPA